MESSSKRLEVLGIAFAGALFAAAILAGPLLAVIAGGVLALSVLLLVADLASRERSLRPRLSWRLRRESYGAIDTKDFGIKGYEVRFRLRVPRKASRFRVTADQPILIARITIELMGESGLVGWWGVDSEHQQGNSAEFEFSSPALDQRHLLCVRVDSTKSVRILEVRMLRPRRRQGTAASDLMELLLAGDIRPPV